MGLSVQHFYIHQPSSSLSSFSLLWVGFGHFEKKASSKIIQKKEGETLRRQPLSLSLSFSGNFQRIPEMQARNLRIHIFHFLVFTLVYNLILNTDPLLSLQFLQGTNFLLIKFLLLTICLVGYSSCLKVCFNLSSSSPSFFFNIHFKFTYLFILLIDGRNM